MPRLTAARPLRPVGWKVRHGATVVQAQLGPVWRRRHAGRCHDRPTRHV